MPGQFLYPRIGFDRSGRGVLVAGDGGVSPLGADDLPGPVTPDKYAGGGFGFYGTDRMVAVGLLNAGGTPPPLRPWFATGVVGAALERPQLLPGIAYGLGVSVAADRRGDIAVLAADCRSRDYPCTRVAVYLFDFKAGKRVGRPTLLAANANLFPPALAMNDSGEVLAVWSQDVKPGTSVLYARTRSPSGRLRARQALGPAGPQGFISAAVGPAGQAIVAWATEIVIECRPGPAAFRAATARAGHGFGRARLLEKWDFERCGGELSAPGVQVAIDATGRGLIAWVGRTRGKFAIRYAHADAGRIGAVQTASPPDADASLDRLALGPHGEALLLWTRNQGGLDASGPESLIAATEPAAGSGFGPPELVAEQAVNYGADAAFDPVSGRAIAVWSNDNQSASYALRQPVLP